MSALQQLRLIVVAATLGVIVGSLVLLPRDDLRPVAIAATAGIMFLVLTFAAGALTGARMPAIAGAYAFRLGQVAVTCAGAVAIVIVFNVLVGSDVRGTSPGPTKQPAPLKPSPTAASHASGSITPTSPTTPSTSSAVPAETPRQQPEVRSAVPSPAPISTPSPAPTSTRTPSSPSPTPAPTPTSLIPTLPPLTLPPLPTATIQVP